MLIRPPKNPLPVRILALLLALVVALLIARLVFTFGWYASGLAAHKEQEKLRQETPINLQFADPNAGSQDPPD